MNNNNFVAVIDSEQMKDEMARLPGEYASVIEELAKARVVRARAEQDVKMIRFVVEKHERDLFKNGIVDKKPTEDAIKMEVALHPKVKAAQEALLDAEEKCYLLEAKKEAYNCKRDMLVSLSALQRAELDTLRFSGAR
jgi:hypothetical protein